MSCKDHSNCVCDAVQNILDQQEAVEDQCPTSCYTNLLAPTVSPGRDTIPFILYTKKGKPFSAFGGIGGDSFRTPFFRVSNLDDCCATLELLEPDLDGGSPDCNTNIEDIICRTEELERTGFCIEVDLHCFCAIQCLSPDLVESVLSGAGRHKKKHR